MDTDGIQKLTRERDEISREMDRIIEVDGIGGKLTAKSQRKYDGLRGQRDDLDDRIYRADPDRYVGKLERETLQRRIKRREAFTDNAEDRNELAALKRALRALDGDDREEGDGPPPKRGPRGRVGAADEPTPQGYRAKKEPRSTAKEPPSTARRHLWQAVNEALDGYDGDPEDVRDDLVDRLVEKTGRSRGWVDRTLKVALWKIGQVPAIKGRNHAKAFCCVMYRTAKRDDFEGSYAPDRDRAVAQLLAEIGFERGRIRDITLSERDVEDSLGLSRRAGGRAFDSLERLGWIHRNNPGKGQWVKGRRKASTIKLLLGPDPERFVGEWDRLYAKALEFEETHGKVVWDEGRMQLVHPDRVHRSRKDRKTGRRPR